MPRSPSAEDLVGAGLEGLSGERALQIVLRNVQLAVSPGTTDMPTS